MAKFLPAGSVTISHAGFTVPFIRFKMYEKILTAVSKTTRTCYLFTDNYGSK